MLIQPYLNFDGRCEEAINFYKKALGAELIMLMRNSETPEKPPPGMLAPGSDNKVCHASFRVGDSTVMASDGGCHGKSGFQGITLNLAVASEAEATKMFKALADGGEVQMPLTKTFYSPSFGMVKDRFGVSWMLYLPGGEKP
ncbi:MAG: VOC family protein [Pirellulaceae bacterium]